MVVEAPGRAPGAAPNPFTGPGSFPGPGALASRRLRRSRDRLTLAVAAALGLGLLLGGGGWVVAVRGPSCDPAALLTVTADPAVAPAVTAVAASLNRARRKAGRCAAVKVSAGRSGETAALFRTGRGTPDVWIPDSSLWLDMLPRAIRPAAGRPPASVASSPLVFVLTTADARRHRSELDRRAWAAFGPGVAADRVFHAARAATPRYLLRVPDPSRTGAGMLTLLALESTVHATTARGVTARFAATMRTVRTLPDGTDLGAALTGVGEDGPAEVAVVPEHRAWRHTGTRAVRPVETVYPAHGAPYLDFPFFVAARGAADGRTAAALLAELRGADGTAQLRQVGLRSAARTAPAPARPGEDAHPVAAAWERAPARAPRALELARPGAAARVRESWRRIGQSLRVLAVIDRAGAPPGDARARAEGLEAMTGALDTGLTLMAPDTAFGIWEVTGRRRVPHRRLVPVRRLSDRIPSGVTQFYRLDRALDRLRTRTRPAPSRRGLNAAVLAAHRQMEREYGDGLNVVLVFTTRGRREPLEPDHAAAVRSLSRSFRYDRAVSVVVVGFGDGVPPGLRQLARATDGGAYHISSPDRLLDLFKSSDGLRVCDDPRCSD